jgi:polysaccharide biosynthesis protein PelD
MPRALNLATPRNDVQRASLETIGVMALAVGFSWAVHPQDPFWTQSGFPWLWLASTMIALRSGSMLGAAAVGVALACWFALATTGMVSGEFPRSNFLGGLILALLAGEFSDVWNARLNQSNAVNAYVDERLHALTHHHFLLSVSHDRLEQELIARPYTLREMLNTLRRLVLPEHRKNDTLPGAAVLLQLLAQSCRLETVALFELRERQLQNTASAVLGDFSGIDTSDAMLAVALESGQLTHVQSQPFVDVDEPSRYMVCAPVLTSSGQLLGVLVVERMAFTALTLETLQFLTVLLAYYADTVEHAPSTQPIIDKYPRCPMEFAVELVRLKRLLEAAFIRSNLVAFAAPTGAATAEWFLRIDRLKRNVDLGWEHTHEGQRILLMLLPLTDETGVAGYLDRINQMVREQYGTELGTEGIAVHIFDLDDTPALEQLADVFARCYAGALRDVGAQGDA